MKKLIFTLLVSTSSIVSFSQVHTIPTNGNVGIKTQAPTEALEVMGTVKIDSCLIVKDSTVLESDLRVKQKMVVDGKVVMKSNSVAKENFKILGTTNLQGNLKLPNIQEVGNNTSSFLVLNDNGVAKSMSKSSLLHELYSNDCNAIGDTPGGTLFPSPIWQSVSVPNQQTGYLFTGTECPAFVGIGTNTPLHSLDVRGRAFFSSSVGFGGQPNNAAQVLATTSKEVQLFWPIFI